MFEEMTHWHGPLIGGFSSAERPLHATIMDLSQTPPTACCAAKAPAASVTTSCAAPAAIQSPALNALHAPC